MSEIPYGVDPLTYHPREVQATARSSSTLSYETWSALVKAVEDANGAELSAVVLPFLAELGPLAPIVAGAIGFGGKEYVLYIIKGLPHAYPATRGEMPPPIDEKTPGAQPNLPRIGFPLTPLNMTAPKHSPEREASYEAFIRSPFAPVVPHDFMYRHIEQPRVQADIYAPSQTYFLHESRTRPRMLGPNATYAQVGF